jgi:ATP-dependent RNA helicase RhlE
VPIKREQQLVSLHQEEEAKVEIEVLMNMELAIERSTEVEVSAKLIEPEKSDKSLSF